MKVMKLTALFITAAFLEVQAAGIAQSVTLSGKELTLKQVFTAIKKQTGYVVFYNQNPFSAKKTITLTVHDMPLRELLSLVLKDQSFEYVINDKTIFLSPKPTVTGAAEEKQAPGEKAAPPKAMPIHGKVTDSLGQPLLGVSVTIRNSAMAGVTNREGMFTLAANAGDVLVISHIGFETRLLRVTETMFAANNNLVIMLHPAADRLENVEVMVNTGYQTISRERATGSFVLIDQKLFNRNVSPNLLDHINSIASGVLFDTRSNNNSFNQYNNQGRTQKFLVRGLSTIGSGPTGTTSSIAPLVVVDGFAYNSMSPYYQDLNSINPNDIESVTILKDAAAASIWGAQAGNGVIVITTKSGKYNRKPEVSFNSSVMVTTKPGLFSNRVLSAPGYIEVERSLYNQGKYAAYYSAYNNPGASNSTLGKPVSDVVNLLFQVQAGTLTQAEADAQIDALSKHDLRNDYLKYFYKTGIGQQYNVSVRGGALTHKYFLSAGYDNDNGVDYSYQKRYTFLANNTFMPMKGLEITLPITVSNNQTGLNVASTSSWGATSLAPYTRLTNENGQPQNVTWAQGFAPYFISKLASMGFYDMSFNPINQFFAPQYGHASTLLVTASPNIKYTIGKGFSAQVQYQYSRTTRDTRNMTSDSVWSVKNTINNYTQVGANGVLSYPINRGGQYSIRSDQQVNNNLRLSLSFNRELHKDHRIDAIVGYERNEVRINSNQNGWYGYNIATGSYQTLVDNFSSFPLQNYVQANYPFTVNSQIQVLQSALVQQFTALISNFGNAAYTYKRKYTLSGSARMDQTNLFGVNTNNRRKILWSSGAAWKINEEDFYHIKWLPLLKLRATYGYQGNIPAIGVRSLATINYNVPTTNSSGLPYATLNNIPNPNLRWEKVGQLNLALDFAIRKNILTGSVEYYEKKGTDLIAPYNIDPSTGATTKTGNIANMKGRGLDLTLNSNNINGKDFQWGTTLLFSLNRDRLTAYFVTTTASQVLSLQANNPYPTSITPIVGNAVYGVYSLRSAGLDAAGNPQGYDTLGKISTNYTQIINYTRLKDMVYHGSGLPTRFASLLNNFTYKGVTVSANVTYKGGYYFHVQSVNYNNLFSGNMVNAAPGSIDYLKRWQQPGDEQHTRVPAMPTLANASSARDNFYQYSSDLVQKADNLRLRDVSLSYDITSLPALQKFIFSKLQVYSYFQGDLLLWKANTVGIDPDYPSMRQSRMISFGIRGTFK